MKSSLTERDGLIRQHWHIAALTSELNDQPIQRVIYDRPYVLFRDKDKKATCLLDRCLHRHALLSEGDAKDGQLKCPYHGWKYDSEGTVISIPSEGPDYPCGKHKTTSYQIIEQEGVIWVWLHETPPTEIPWNFPRYNEQGWVHYFMVTDFDNEVTNLVENFMDVPHTVFVHKGWFRNKGQTKVPMTVETKDGKVLVTYEQGKDEIAPLLKPLMNPNNETMFHTDEFIFPNITSVTYSYGDKYGVHINSQCTPVSSMKTKVYTYIAYRLVAISSVIKPFIQYYTRQVIEQDVIIMKNQSKSLKFDPRTTFRSTPADEVHKAIERLRHWGETDLEKVKTFEAKTKAEFWL
jgi:phenylpropionate dioxygenase-like ring-hydroxylating dioxygenase large terminal subunit